MQLFHDLLAVNIIFFFFFRFSGPGFKKKKTKRAAYGPSGRSLAHPCLRRSTATAEHASGAPSLCHSAGALVSPVEWPRLVASWSLSPCSLSPWPLSLELTRSASWNAELRTHGHTEHRHTLAASFLFLSGQRSSLHRGVSAAVSFTRTSVKYVEYLTLNASEVVKPTAPPQGLAYVLRGIFE